VSEVYVASFKLHLVCSNCLRRSSRTVDVPDVEDAPTDVDDFVYSGMMNRLRFSCGSCQGLIAEVVGVDPLPLPAGMGKREGVAA